MLLYAVCCGVTIRMLIRMLLHTLSGLAGIGLVLAALLVMLFLRFIDFLDTNFLNGLEHIR